MSTRVSILDAAARIASEAGPLGLTVDKIVAQAGVSKGSFFFHFATKEVMLRALLETVADRFEDRIASFEVDGTPFCRALVAATIDELSSSTRLIAVLIAAVAVDNSLACIVVNRVDRWRSRLLADGLKPDQVWALRAMLDGILLGSLLRNVPPQPDELFHSARIIERAVGALA